jgi:hypothetical protein
MKRQLFVLASIYLVWLVSLCAATQGFSGFHTWLTSWTTWDALWYARIWDEGYPRVDPRALVFPPGYSMLIGFLARGLHLDFHVMAMVVNLTSYFGAMVLAVDLFKNVLGVSPVPAFTLALSFPAAYFIFPSYSDAVFCLILWAAIYLAVLYKGDRLARAGEVFLLLLAPWIRLTGYALICWLALGRWTAVAVGVSLLGWLALNFVVAGQPTYFLHAQQLFHMPKGNLIEGLRITFSKLYPVYLPGLAGDWTGYLQFHLLPAVYLVALALVGLWFWDRGQRLIGMTIWAILILSHNQSFWRSAVRYDLPVACCLSVPILVALHEKAAGARLVRISLWLVLAAMTVAQLALQVYFANLFRSGHWAF